MDIKALIIETLVLIILFTFVTLRIAKDPLNVVYDMPQKIIDRCADLGMIKERRKTADRKTVIRKTVASVVFVLLFAAMLYFINGARSFIMGAVLSYIIWTVIDWYDCIVLDWIIFCHNPKMIIPGTEDLKDAYKDYGFHALGSLKGMLLGLPVAALTGFFVQLLTWISA